MRLIEITGIPGSGKSTITPIINKFLKTEGFKVYDKYILILSCDEFPLNRSLSTMFIRLFPAAVRDKILALSYRILDNKRIYMAHYLLENWKFYETTMNNILKSPIPLYQKNWLVLWWFNLISTYQMAMESLGENSILILDEGFYHKVINFFVHLGHDLEYLKIEAYVKCIPPIDILIQVETSIEKCLERLTKRALPRVIRGSTTSEVRNYLVNTKKAIEYSNDIISANGTKIIKIDNSISPLSPKNIITQLSKEANHLALNNKMK